MSRIIVLDTFPLSSVGKHLPSRRPSQSVLDACHRWVGDCEKAGARIIVPAIAFYETLRELERLGADSQIARLRRFCHEIPGRYLPLEDAHLNHAAKLWANARNAGVPTAGADALDGDVILAAQTLAIEAAPGGVVVATTNVSHLSRYVKAELWSNIIP